MTSRVKGYPFEVALPKGSGVIGVVLAYQLKRLDWRARHYKVIAVDAVSGKTKSMKIREA